MNRRSTFGLTALLIGLCAAAAAEQKPPEIFTLGERASQPALLDAEVYSTWLVRFSEDPLPKFLNSLDKAPSKRSGRLDIKGPAARTWLALLEEQQQSHRQECNCRDHRHRNQRLVSEVRSREGSSGMTLRNPVRHAGRT